MDSRSLSLALKLSRLIRSFRGLSPALTAKRPLSPRDRFGPAILNSWTGIPGSTMYGWQ